MSIQDEIARAKAQALQIHALSAALIATLTGENIHATAEAPPVATPSPATPPAAIPATPPPVAATTPYLIPNIKMTCWGTEDDEQRGEWDAFAYNYSPAPTPDSGKHVIGFAAPWHASRGDQIKVTYRPTGQSVTGPIIDCGPWNTDDPYYLVEGRRPQAETGTDKHGRATNRAGIDATPAAWAKLLGKTPQECWQHGPSEFVDIEVIPATPVPGRAAAAQHVSNPDELARARSAIGHGILYSQDTAGGTGGDDPTTPLPGYHHSDGTVTCDCSLYLAWAARYRRADHWNTAGICSDARGAQTAFTVIVSGSAQVGDLYCYHTGVTGHCGYISQVAGGVPTAVIHCHSGNAPAIQETSCEIFTSHSALIVRYHGPTVG